MSQKRIKELAEQILLLRTQKQDLEKQLEDVKDEISQVQEELKPLMEALEAQSLKIEGVGTIYLQTAFYVRAIPERREDLVVWLDEHGLGELAKRTVHAQTLQAEYQGWTENDKPLPPPELVSAYPKTEVRIRKAS